VALAAVVKADALKLHFGWLGPMLSLRAHADAAGRALLPAMISLVIALGDRGAEALQAIISAFSAIVDAPTNDQSLCQLEAGVAPIFRDPQSERKLHPVFQSLFRTLWPALDGLWESARAVMQRALSSLVETVLPWGFFSTEDLWAGIVQALEICPMPEHAAVVRHCVSELLEFQNETAWMYLHGLSLTGVTLCSHAKQWQLSREDQ
jgi:hypothetical protein